PPQQEYYRDHVNARSCSRQHELFLPRRANAGQLSSSTAAEGSPPPDGEGYNGYRAPVNGYTGCYRDSFLYTVSSGRMRRSPPARPPHGP
ncbi:unnamed protein product, partial [Amoebophrya sp. A25]